MLDVSEFDRIKPLEIKIGELLANYFNSHSALLLKEIDAAVKRGWKLKYTVQAQRHPLVGASAVYEFELKFMAKDADENNFWRDQYEKRVTFTAILHDDGLNVIEYWGG